MRSFVLLASLVALIALAPLRYWCTITLMTKYRTDEYISNPKARLLYVLNMLGALAVGALVVVFTYATGIWWVETAGWIFFAFVVYRIGQKLRMRLNGSYREFYKSIQWR